MEDNMTRQRLDTWQIMVIERALRFYAEKNPEEFSELAVRQLASLADTVEQAKSINVSTNR
jgi:hypothetical protein